jgi:hypothetical protein
MEIREWSKANADYGRRLFSSGMEGARSGREEFLDGEPLTPFLSQTVQHSFGIAAIGACIGALGSFAAYRRETLAKAVGFGLLGGLIGLAAGVVWESRRLTASVAGSALTNIGKARDERWLAKHPIDYA